MFSKLKPLISIALVAIGVGGCNANVGDTVKKNRELTLSGAKVGCLNDFGKKIEKYFQARMREGELTEFIGCFQRSLTLFEEYTVGDNPEGYHPHEIRNFLARYFIKDKPVTDEHVRALMRLKASWIGGSEELVTRNELHRFVTMLDTVKVEAVRLRPYIPVLNPWIGFERHSQRQSLPSLAEASQALLRAADRLGALAQGHGATYRFDDFTDYLTELRRFIHWEKNHANGASEKAWTDFIKAFKSMTVSPEAEEIRAGEWRRFLQAGAAWYSLWLRYRYELKPEDILVGRGLDNLIKTVDTSFLWIQRGIDHQPEKVITFAQFDRLIQALAAVEALPSSAKPATLQKTLRTVVTKVFGDPRRKPSEREIAGLDTEVLNRVRREFNSWSEVQQLLYRELRSATQELDYSRLPDPGDVDVIRRLSSLDFRQIRLPLDRSPRAAMFIDHLQSRVKPLFKHIEEQNPKAFIVSNKRREQERIISSYYDLSLKAALTPAIRAIISGYSEDPRRAFAIGEWTEANESRRRQQVAGLTEGEMRQFITDVSDLALEMGILHPKAEAVGERLFVEGNLFTYSGNGVNPPNAEGDHLLVFEEGLELLAFIITNINFSHKIFYQDLEKTCGAGEGGTTPPLDVLGMVQLQRDCFITRYRDLVRNNLNHASGMQEHLKGMTDEQWRSFMTVLLAAVAKYDDQTGPNGPRWVQYTQLATMSMIVHYVEAILTRYDSSENNKLDATEAENAFSTFRGLLDLVLREVYHRQESEARIRDIFMYILTHGEFPQELNFGRLGTYQTLGRFAWAGTLGRLSVGLDGYVPSVTVHPSGWNVDLNRYDLLKAFHLIVSSAENKRRVEMPPPPPEPRLTPEQQRRNWGRRGENRGFYGP